MSELTLTAGHAEQEFEQIPLGEHSAILVDIILSKGEETNYGVKDVLYFYFELEEKMNDGRPFLARKKFNYSLNEKSNLYKFLTKWRGKPFKNGEAVDLSAMLGTGCVMEIEPWTPEGSDKTLHLVDRARKLAKKDWPKASGQYDGDKVRERIEARKAEQGGAPAPAPQPQPAAKAEEQKGGGYSKTFNEDDDIPF